MKRFVKGAEDMIVKGKEDTITLHQLPDFFDLFTSLTGLNGMGKDDFNLGQWAALHGNDIIIDSGNGGELYIICKNAAKYIDEFFAVNSEEEQEEFNKTHPDVEYEAVESIDEILW